MPSLVSTSVLSVRDSSTVMTPSLPTFSIASAMRSPIDLSLAEIDATCAIFALLSTTCLNDSISLTAISTAFSMPRLMSSGLLPAVTLRRPSRMIACASTVAVVVPSPAMSLVFEATSLTSCAPMFSNTSGSSISLAIVTPSLVIVGEPNFLSSTTLRPLGPSVTFTASARRFAPRSSARRAFSSKIICLAAMLFLQRSLHAGRDFVDDGEHVFCGDDEILFAIYFDFGTRILRIDDTIAGFHRHRKCRAVVEHAAGTDRADDALLRLLLRGVGQEDAGRGLLILLDVFHDDAIAQRLEIHENPPEVENLLWLALSAMECQRSDFSRRNVGLQAAFKGLLGQTTKAGLRPWRIPHRYGTRGTIHQLAAHRSTGTPRRACRGRPHRSLPVAHDPRTKSRRHFGDVAVGRLDRLRQGGARKPGVCLGWARTPPSREHRVGRRIRLPRRDAPVPERALAGLGHRLRRARLCADASRPFGRRQSHAARDTVALRQRGHRARHLLRASGGLRRRTHGCATRNDDPRRVIGSIHIACAALHHNART